MLSKVARGDVGGLGAAISRGGPEGCIQEAEGAIQPDKELNETRDMIGKMAKTTTRFRKAHVGCPGDRHGIAVIFSSGRALTELLNRSALGRMYSAKSDKFARNMALHLVVMLFLECCV